MVELVRRQRGCPTKANRSRDSCQVPNVRRVPVALVSPTPVFVSRVAPDFAAKGSGDDRRNVVEERKKTFE